MKLSHLTRAALGTICLLTGADSVSAADTPDQMAVREVLMRTFDKPENRLSVDPVVVERDAAIAGWTQGEMGGRALLRLRNKNWVLILCGGDGLKAVATLEQVGLSPTQAETLAGALASAEKTVAPARLARFSRFDGIMMMDGG